MQKYKPALWNTFLVLLPIIWFTPVFWVIVLTESNSLFAEILLHASSLFGVFNPAIKLVKSLLAKVIVAIVFIVLWAFILVYYGAGLAMVI